MSDGSKYIRNQDKEIDGDRSMHEITKERSKKSTREYADAGTQCGVCPQDPAHGKMSPDDYTPGYCYCAVCNQVYKGQKTIL